MGDGRFFVKATWCIFGAIVTAFAIAGIAVVKGLYFDTLSGPDPWGRLGSIIVIVPVAMLLASITVCASIIAKWKSGLTNGTLFLLGMIMGNVGLVPFIPSNAPLGAVRNLLCVAAVLVFAGLVLIRSRVISRHGS